MDALVLAVAFLQVVPACTRAPHPQHLVGEKSVVHRRPSHIILKWNELSDGLEVKYVDLYKFPNGTLASLSPLSKGLR